MSDVKMVTKLTIWDLNEKEGKWYGRCVECKGEKAQYTPQVLKQKGIKPCQTCTDLDEYNKASSHKEKEQDHGA